MDVEINQILYYLYKEYLVGVDSRENIIGRYTSFYVQLADLIEKGILTYEVDLCGNVKEESIEIVNTKEYYKYVNETGLSAENIVEMFSPIPHYSSIKIE